MKAAVIFPGIGYHSDKPLLYYSKKSAAAHGYQIFEVSYGNLPKNIKGSPEKMEQAFSSALSQAEAALSEIPFVSFEEILFLSKSIGTAVASVYAEKHGIHAKNIYFTPVEASLPFLRGPGIVFHGAKDSWADTGKIREGCREKHLPLHIVPNADHSLETGNLAADLENLKQIIMAVDEWLA